MTFAAVSCDSRSVRRSRGGDGASEQTSNTEGEVSGGLTELGKLPDKDDVKVTEPTEPTGQTAQADHFCELYGASDTVAYSAKEMTIRLPKTFSEESYEGFDAVYDSGLVAIFIIRQGFDTEYVNSAWTVEEYAEAVIASNSQYTYTEVDTDGGYALTTHSSSGYFYLSAMYKSNSAFWYYQFACEEADADAMRPYAAEWLASATYN